MKPTVRAIYWFSKNYTNGIVYMASLKTGQRAAVITCTPNKGLSRRERYDELCSFISRHDGSKLVPPAYKPTRKES